MVNSISEQARMMIGIAICNLLCCPTAQNTAIANGGVSVLKVLAVTDIEDMKESIARVSINLVSQLNLKKVLLEESLVPVLILFLQQESKRVFDIALHSVSAMAQIVEYRVHMIDEGIVTSLVSAVISGKWNSPLFAMRVCQIFCLLSFSYERAESMVFDSQITLAFHLLYRNQICTPKAACLIAICLRNLSFDVKARVQLIKHNCLKLLGAVLTDVFTNSKNEFPFIRQCVLPFLHNVCLESSLHMEIMKQGLMKLLFILTFRKRQDDYEDTETDDDDDEDEDDDFDVFRKKRENKDLTYEVPVAIVKLGEQARKSFRRMSSSHIEIPSSSMNSNKSGGLGSSLPTPTSLSSVGRKPSMATLPAQPGEAEIIVTGRIGNGDHNTDIEDLYSLPASKRSMKSSVDLMSNDIHHIAQAISLVTSTEACYRLLIDSKCVKIFSFLVDNKYIIDLSRHEIATAICRLSSTKRPEDKQMLSDQGAAEILMSIANTVSRKDTQQQCSLALGYLSDITKVNRGVVGSLLLLSFYQDGKGNKDNNASVDLNQEEEDDGINEQDENDVIMPIMDASSSAVSSKGPRMSFHQDSGRRDSNSQVNLPGQLIRNKSVRSVNTSSDEAEPSMSTKGAIDVLKKRYSVAPKRDKHNQLQKGGKELLQEYLAKGLKSKGGRNNLMIAGVLMNPKSTSEDIQDAILPSGGFKITQHEIDMCFVDYSLYLFEVFESTVKPEMAGPASKVQFPNLSLPKATVRKGADLSTRYTQLPPVPHITDPLPKDLSPVSLDMDLKDQRDDVNTQEVGDGFNQLPDMGFSDVSRKFSKPGKDSSGRSGGETANRARNRNTMKFSKPTSKVGFNRKTSNRDSISSNRSSTLSRSSTVSRSSSIAGPGQGGGGGSHRNSTDSRRSSGDNGSNEDNSEGGIDQSDDNISSRSSSQQGGRRDSAGTSSNLSSARSNNNFPSGEEPRGPLLKIASMNKKFGTSRNKMTVDESAGPGPLLKLTHAPSARFAHQNSHAHFETNPADSVKGSLSHHNSNLHSSKDPSSLSTAIASIRISKRSSPSSSLADLNHPNGNGNVRTSFSKLSKQEPRIDF